MPHSSVKPSSLLSRPLDLIYVVWFIIHLATTILIDLVELYPTALQPQPLLDIRADYIATYRDPLAINPPPWFTFYIWLEGIYQVPLCIYAIYALWHDRSSAPVHLLIYAVQTALTTSTCLVEIYASSQINSAEKASLAWLFGAWAVIPALLGFDMLLRIRRVLVSATSGVEAAGTVGKGKGKGGKVE